MDEQALYLNPYGSAEKKGPKKTFYFRNCQLKILRKRCDGEYVDGRLLRKDILEFP